MIVVSVNPNAIYIPTIQSAGDKLEFDSSYPVHLNGIISQNEFRESINRINRVVFDRKMSKLFIGIVTTSIIVGLIFIVVGKIIATNSSTSISPPLFGIGVGIITVAVLIFLIVWFNLSSRNIASTRQAINKESMKYLSRFPTPCSWRLDTMRQYEKNHNTTLVYHFQGNLQRIEEMFLEQYLTLMIEIGYSNVPENGTHYSNQVASESTAFVAQQDDSAPPPYSNQAAGFCSQCGAPRQTITASFCSSCGHSFN